MRMARTLHHQGKRLLTAAEFERLPKEDPYRVELVRGRLVRAPRPGSLHARLLIRLSRLLDEFVERASNGVVLGDPGVFLARDPDTVRGPDLAFFTHERIPASSYATTIWGPPDLAIEILSPSDRAGGIREKVNEYLDAGVRVVWVIDPRKRAVTIHRPGGAVRHLLSDDVLEGDDVLPGFRLPLVGFFTL